MAKKHSTKPLKHSPKQTALPSAYEPARYEQEIYARWEKSGAFNPDNLQHTKGHYANIMPPPNANGELHIGHASGYAVMDALGRFQRMQGKKTLLLPGKDHAGIQTQVTFENLLQKEKGVTRHQLGREKFYEEIYKFCTDRAQYMRAQEKRFGLSADYSREKFTLDPELSKTVLTTFVKMYNDGLIYQGNRIINWCSRCASAISDLEVEHKNLQGKLWYLRYEFTDGEGDLTVATTRPETMLGDTALAVNPRDKRYQRYVGRTVILPLVGREIPVIADENIDATFGTGVVKVTPAHDPVDFEIGQRHNLPQIAIFDVRTGRISDRAPRKYRGHTMLAARKMVLEDLQTEGALVKEEDHGHSVGHCERCKTIVEPLVSKQWFVNVDHPNFSLKKQTLALLKKKKVSIYPKRFEKTFFQWFENLHDWTISRQIWWGHRVPAYYCAGCKELMVSIEQPTSCTRCGKTKFTQDPNTLDTWFSSGQWAYTTLGYQHDLPKALQSEDYQTFFPSDVMVMGRDILFFWASRMLMMSLYTTNLPPFKSLYFTGLVRDKEGKKMSKSKGNGVDVLKVIDQYGADALRLTVLIGATPGNDIRVYEEKIVGFRNFVNKLWNVGRFVTMQEVAPKAQPKTKTDQWITQRLNALTAAVTGDLNHLRLGEAGQKLYDFLWHDFADWYLEIKKLEPKGSAVPQEILRGYLRLLHPFAPFVTEKLWEQLGSKELLLLQSWPKASARGSATTEKHFARIQELVIALRNLRATYRIAPGERLQVILPSKLTNEWQPVVTQLARVEAVRKLPVGGSLSRAVALGTCKISLAGKVDVEAELARLTKEEAELHNYLQSVDKKLHNKAFLANAPADVVAQSKARAQEIRDKMKAVAIHKTEVEKLR